MLNARYIMVGGFLGAGKTTAILRLAQLLEAEGQRIGLITNDQSVGLVDTQMLSSHGYATEEITGGCFCCKFTSLMEAASKLTTETAPDILIAEPVGSCTDLKATVSYPLQQMYGDQYSIAPLSVMIDPLRAARVLGLEAGKNFSQKVRYIYEKQLEEADIIVINKCDLLDESQLGRLEDALRKRFSNATLVRMIARTNQGISDWWHMIQSQTLQQRAAMDVDYDVYAEGEALLGWLNAGYQLEAAEEWDGNQLLDVIGRRVQQRIEAADGQVAHLKMTLSPDVGNDLAVANLVRTESSIELAFQLQSPLSAGSLTVNVRAEMGPDELKRIVQEELRDVFSSHRLKATPSHLEAFQPGRPTPTHRVT
ncbi:MAG: GTP-binding protein [Pirellulaceae bacterium]